MTPADEIPRSLSRIVPLVYWQSLIESFLAARDRAVKTPSELTFAAVTERP
jgi:hypothetical protein